MKRTFRTNEETDIFITTVLNSSAGNFIFNHLYFNLNRWYLLFYQEKKFILFYKSMFFSD